MPATEANTLVVGADGYEYMISGRMGTCRHDVWGLASRFGIDEENEPLLYIAVVRAMFERYDYHWIRDYETFGDDEPRTFRKWIRAYRNRFAADLPVWRQLGRC